MMKALLVTGASVVFGQGTFCFQQPLTNCSTSGIPGCAEQKERCTRRLGATACDTASATACTTAMCINGASVVDGKTCSKCVDNCGSKTDNATCFEAATMDQCVWVPKACGGFVFPPQPCSGASSTACTGEPGCFWTSFNTNLCNVAKSTPGFCSQCNGTYAAVRSALKNNIGKTCKWATTSTGFSTNAFTLSIGAAAQSATECPAFTAADKAADEAALTKAAADKLFSSPLAAIEGTPVITCTMASGAASFLPSLAILGLIASVVA